MFSKTKDFILLPVRNMNCQYTSCYDIYSSTNILLRPNIVNNIDTGIVVNLPPEQVITIKNNFGCKPDWQNTARFLFGNPFTNELTIPILSSKMCNIEARTHLVHITLTDLDEFANLDQGI